MKHPSEAFIPLLSRCSREYQGAEGELARAAKQGSCPDVHSWVRGQGQHRRLGSLLPTPHCLPKMFCATLISESHPLDQAQAYLKPQQNVFFHFASINVPLPKRHSPAEQLLPLIPLVSYKKSHFNLFPGSLCLPVCAGEMDSSFVKVQLSSVLVIAWIRE